MTIFMMWYQGLAEAPPLVQRIHRLWQVANPDREVRLIDGPKAEAIISGLGVDAARLSMQQRANMVRVALLADHGGAWVDATLLPARPLADWLPALVAPSGFFAHRTRGWTSAIQTALWDQSQVSAITCWVLLRVSAQQHLF